MATVKNSNINKTEERKCREEWERVRKMEKKKTGGRERREKKIMRKKS